MKKPIIVVFIAVIVFGVAYFYMTSDNQKDKWVWGKLLNQLTEENIKEISLNNAVLKNDEFVEVLSLITESEFDKSNRVGHGPTPKATMKIILIDGTTIFVGYWGGATFELSSEHIDAESQFLVTSDSLGEWFNLK